ncbi:MAG TPA: DUF5716 family protein [Lachnospiraceae bacterium]|nr:DUF5716 family protein [Lachnospiraceae bacterium]
MAFDTKYVIGYDLNNEMSQMSFCSLKNPEPETFSTVAGEQKYMIPTVLCKKRDVNQWFFGEEAKKVMTHDEGELVDSLLEKTRAGEELVIDQEEYNPMSLLVLFMKRTLNMLNTCLSMEDVEVLMITVDVLDPVTLDILETVAEELPIAREKIFFQSYAESIYCYTLHQPVELWKHRVMVFDYAGPYLKSFGLYMNEKTKPVVAFIDSATFEDIRLPEKMYPNMEEQARNERMDDILLQAIRESVDRYTISSVYLIGDGFEGDYLKKTLKYLCMGRRVFQGMNLYTKGACYSAMEKLVPGPFSESHIFLGKDKLKFNLGIKVKQAGEEKYAALVDAGVNWYETKEKYDFILGGDPIVPLIITPLDGKDVQVHEIALTGLPMRPAKATRLSLRISFGSEHLVRIRINDLGFGEMYPSTGKVWDEEIEI